MSIELRPFTREEYHDFYRCYQPDPLMDPNPYHYSHEHVDRCFDYDLSRKDWYPVFGIFDDVGCPVGTLALKRIDTLYKRCELGVMLANDSVKNRGYGTAAIKQAIDMAQNVYGLEHILADTMGQNLRMQHVLEKLGFRFVERTEHVYDMKGHWEDRLDYVLDLAGKETHK